MECRDVRELADSFLCEELLTETNHDILRHLETCPLCRADVAARRAMREAVKRAFESARFLDPDPDLRSRVRQSLGAARAIKPVRRGLRFPGWWALAATVLIAAAVGLAFRGRTRIAPGNALARAAAGDHRDCALQFRLAEKPISLEEAAGKYGAVYAVLQTQPPDELPTPAGPVRVLARHACVYQGRRFAHVVMDYRGTRVSLLVTADAGAFQGSDPSDLHAALHGERVDAMSIVSLHTARQAIFLVGDVPAAEIERLAEAISASVYPALSGV
jgi:anti-sigma factor RsiW